MANIDSGASSANQGGANSAPPGWYPTEQGQRYWDGGQWLSSPPPGMPQAPGMGTVGQGTVGQPMAVDSNGGWQHPSGISSEERQMAMLAHLLTLVAGFLAPLIIYFTKKDESAFIRHHAAEALNLTITILLAIFGPMILFFGGAGLLAIASTDAAFALFAIGYLLFFVIIFAVSIGSLIFTIMAGIAANRGEWYRIPFCFHWVK